MNVRNCGQCVCATKVWNGAPDLMVCANVFGHEGQLTQVTENGPVSLNSVEMCRNFRKRRESLNPNVRFIPLGDGLSAMVDASDYEWLNRFTWRATSKDSKGYAFRKAGGRIVLMHRAIMEPPKGMVVDHINGNRMDDRRCNLRICTPLQNGWNRRSTGGTSRFKGVHLDRRSGKWIARIRYLGRTIRIGSFDDEVQAARAYDRMAMKLFGEFAYLNFPGECPKHVEEKEAGRMAPVDSKARRLRHARARCPRHGKRRPAHSSIARRFGAYRPTFLPSPSKLSLTIRSCLADLAGPAP